MYVEKSIDVIIPSYRLDEAILLSIFQLRKPDDFYVQFYLVADNPNLEVPESLNTLVELGEIVLIRNERNLGFSATRNKGIRQGKSKWVLLLDDDVSPSDDLLLAYSNAIHRYPEAIGFAGVTFFPLPYDAETTALNISGSIGHNTLALTENELMWVPTPNMMLNRIKMDPSLFNESLHQGGEDIEFLVRNAQRNQQKYISVPDAQVEHPWWTGGDPAKRNFRYGGGAGQISSMPAIKSFTYYDFLNPIEALLLIMLMSPLIVSFCSWTVLWSLIFMIISTELIISYMKAIFQGRSYSLLVAWYLFSLKNSYEAGFLWANIVEGKFSGFARRIDVSFRKQHPSWFRLNKWKIIKIILTLTSLYFIFR